MKDELNRRKRREEFRPFAASILEDQAAGWLVDAVRSPFMLIVCHVRPERRHEVPALLHVDGSVRLQTTCGSEDEPLSRLLRRFFALTRIPMVLNTSLNGRGQPLVCEPDEAVRLVLARIVDVLVIGNYEVSLQRTDARSESTSRREGERDG